MQLVAVLLDRLLVEEVSWTVCLNTSQGFLMENWDWKKEEAKSQSSPIYSSVPLDKFVFLHLSCLLCKMKITTVITTIRLS